MSGGREGCGTRPTSAGQPPNCTLFEAELSSRATGAPFSCSPRRQPASEGMGLYIRRREGDSRYA